METLHIEMSEIQRRESMEGCVSREATEEQTKIGRMVWCVK